MEENNSLNLEKMNSRYLALKSNLETKRSNFERLEKEISDLEDDIKIIDATIIISNRAADTNAVNIAKQNRKNKLNILSKKKEEAELQKEELEEFKNKIDEVLDKIKENPEMKKHIDQVLAKRYDRQNRKIGKIIEEKEKARAKEIKKAYGIKAINDLIKNHPSMNNNLKGILQNKAEIKKLLEQKQTLESKTNKTPDDIKKISDINNEIINKNKKVEKNKQLMMNYISKNKLKITEKDIDDLSNHTVLGKKGQVDINKTLNASMKQSKNNIERIDAEIARQSKKFNINRQAIINFGEIPTEIQSDRAEIDESRNNVETIQDSFVETEQKPKWFQFVKRFKAWNERRKQKAISDGSEKYETAISADTKHGEFADSLKYEIIQDIVKKESREAQKTARKEYNESERNDDDAR